MPELPDITIYIEALERRIAGQTLERVQVRSPFLLRTAAPPLSSVEGRPVKQLRRIGKRVVIGFEDELWLVLHLMIAGRLHWHDSQQARLGGKQVAASFRFPKGVLVLTEAGTKKRASLHLVQGEAALRGFDAGGLDLVGASTDAFATALTCENHTLKRALTDPRLFSGIGNAYSDEILHEACLSPVALTRSISREQIDRLHQAVVSVLAVWTARLRKEAGDGFPEKVTAFRPEMAVHGKFGNACPRCGAKVQRIRYAENETNYCPTCQTGGRLLADRSLSRLLRDDWPRSADELDEMRQGRAMSQAAATRTLS